MDKGKEISPVGEAVGAAGGQVALAAKLKISQQAVQQWVAKGVVPAKRVLAVEAASGVPRYKLRPDLYPASKGAWSVKRHQQRHTDRLPIAGNALAICGAEEG